MPRATRGSVYRESKGTWGIRWPEGGSRPQKGGFRTKTEAREWFDEHVGPRLRRGGPSAEITFAAFTHIYLERWGATVSERTTSPIVYLVPRSGWPSLVSRRK